MRVLVSGANGRTGRPIIQALAKAGATVRAFLRRADQAPDLEALGATEYAVGDMRDVESIHRALRDCDKLVHIGPPMDPDEVEQTRNFITAAKNHELAHFVYYSVMHPLRREVRHHRLKLDAEEELIESGLAYTIVQPCRYMQHLEAIWPAVSGDGVHAMPFHVDRTFSVVDLLDLAEAVARITTRASDHGATYELAGPEPLSQRQMAAIISEVIGKPVEARATPIDAMRAAAAAKGFSEDKIEQMVIMNSHYDRYGFPGNANILSYLLGRSPTTFAEYVKRLASA